MASSTFVVGTGRCGSTMISRMLRKHPAVLSLSEFFAGVTDLTTRTPQAFPEGVIEASQFWRILNTCYPKLGLINRQTGFKRETRFINETGLPPLLRETFPHLTAEYDTLFGEMEVFVASLSPATIDQHYRHLFTWLQHRFERQVWIERSGASLEIMPYLYRAFPDAKFIHIVRDGRNVAISAGQHYVFRLIMLNFQFIDVLGIDPFESEDRSNVEKLSSELRALLPESFDTKEFLNYNPPLSLYGHHWSRMIVEGLRVLSEVPSDQILTLRYEDFQEEPEASVRKFISFVGQDFVDEEWVNTAVSLVRPARSAWKSLPSEQQEWLSDACLPGFEALKALDLSWG